MTLTEQLFNFANTFILLFWIPLLFIPQWKITQRMIRFPFVPFLLSFFYLFFLIQDGKLVEADFSSLNGILRLFHTASPAAVAAAWMHYLAFDYWVACWLLDNAQKSKIPHLLLILPLLCTFMLGPVGVLLYVFIRQIYLKFNR